MLENPERFGPLERDCRKAVCRISDDETELDEPLSRLAHDFASRQPALAITFARAAIASNPDRDFDNEILLDVIRDARVDLDLGPGGDPAEALFGEHESVRNAHLAPASRAIAPSAAPMTPALGFERIVGQCPAERHCNRIFGHRDLLFFNRPPAFPVFAALPLGSIAGAAVFTLPAATMPVADLRGLAGALSGAFASTDC